MKTTISIIIPTFNRPNTLKDVILSYVCQEYLKEIVIVDDGSTKSYYEFNKFITNVCNDNNIIYKYIKNEVKLGAAGARNIGISIAEGEYILWGEDDLYLSKDYSKVLVDKADNTTILCGSIYYGFTNKITDEEILLVKKYNIEENSTLFNYNTLECSYRRKIEKDIEIPFGHAIILVPKKAYKKCEYFEGYKVNGYREETDAQILMSKSGYTIKYTSDTECYHLGHKYIEKGGQHSTSKLVWEIYAIYNNWLFLDRHYKFLKNKFNLKNSKIYMKLYYLLYRILVRVGNFVGKIKKVIFRGV